MERPNSIVLRIEGPIYENHKLWGAIKSLYTRSLNLFETFN